MEEELNDQDKPVFYGDQDKHVTRFLLLLFLLSFLHQVLLIEIAMQHGVLELLWSVIMLVNLESSANMASFLHIGRNRGPIRAVANWSSSIACPIFSRSRLKAKQSQIAENSVSKIRKTRGNKQGRDDLLPSQKL
jgi:hypothetical protein